MSVPETFTEFRAVNNIYVHHNDFLQDADVVGSRYSRPKRNHGIPDTFMVEVNGPNVRGAMVTSKGSYAVPAINA